MGRKWTAAAACLTAGFLILPVQAAEQTAAEMQPGQELYGIWNSLRQLMGLTVLAEEPLVAESPLPQGAEAPSRDEPAREAMAGEGEETASQSQPEQEAAPAADPAPTPKISLTPQEISMMEYVVEREVHGASYAHKIAIANVIVNRVLDSRFPDTVSEVLHAPRQFPISIQNYYHPKWHPSDETINAVYAAVYQPDTTGGALYFYAPQYTAAKTASWFENSLTFCFEMEGHRFFA